MLGRRRNAHRGEQRGTRLGRSDRRRGKAGRSQEVRSGCWGAPVRRGLPSPSISTPGPWDLEKFVSPNSVAFSRVQAMCKLRPVSGFALLRLLQGSRPHFLPRWGPLLPTPVPEESGVYCAVPASGTGLRCPILSHSPPSRLGFGLQLALTESHAIWLPFCIVSLLSLGTCLLLVLQQEGSLAFRMLHKHPVFSSGKKPSRTRTPPGALGPLTDCLLVCHCPQSPPPRAGQSPC